MYNEWMIDTGYTHFISAINKILLNYSNIILYHINIDILALIKVITTFYTGSIIQIIESIVTNINNINNRILKLTKIIEYLN